MRMLAWTLGAGEFAILTACCFGFVLLVAAVVVIVVLVTRKSRALSGGGTGPTPGAGGSDGKPGSQAP
jgi:hypothetical protein